MKTKVMSTAGGFTSRPSTQSTVRTRGSASEPVSPSSRSARSALTSVGRKSSVLSLRSSSLKINPPNVEPMKQVSPDLPPISQIKTAIARDRVSQGISYILPVDKTRISVNNVYRTNLRAMFQEPYLGDHLGYDDDVIRTSAKHHFVPNRAHTRFKRELLDPDSYRLSSDAEKIRKQYAKSAPTTGLSSRKNMNDSNNLRTRSTLFLPLKVELPEEAKRIKEEAQNIIRAVQEDNDDEYDPTNDIKTLKETPNKLLNSRRESQYIRYYNEFRDMEQDVRETNKSDLQQKGRQFEKYEDFRSLNLPMKPTLPDSLKSSFLTNDKNKDVWNWLTQGETITDHSFFLVMCG